MSNELRDLSMVDAAALIATRDLKPSEYVAAALARFDEVEPLIHAFVSVDREGAIREARIQDNKSGGVLHGIPVAIKDIFDVTGTPTGCGSNLMSMSRAASSDASAVARLRAAGAIILGKTTTHELACGVYTPPTRNPWDLDRSPGGSSGGSGAAVAAGVVPGAIGSDTGGSIRIPASHCGLVGLKPTYGRISRSGALALSWSLDHVGTLTRTVEDAALMLSVLAGPDPNDQTTLARPHLPQPILSTIDQARGLRIGVLADAPFAPMEPDVRQGLATTLKRLEQQGVEIVEVQIPELEACLAAEFAIVAAEAGSYHESRMKRSAALVGADVRGLLETGLLLPASLYLRAQKTRTVILRAFRSLFVDHRLDALIAPTVPAKAQRWDQLEYEFAEGSESVIEALVRTTAPFNLAGLPAVAVPAGMGDSGFPVSVQVAARPFDEQTALRIALAIQRATGRISSPDVALSARGN
ncbi:MAG TPA: amidase [Candidatus Dormibacteraeota bacterium]|nr:amidase [Candidatus Dormibacteraeota bacterium]